MSRYLFILFIILCLFSTLFLPTLAFFIKPAKMQSETWIVISTADSGWGTLRSGLQNATTGDTVTFDSSVFPPTSPVYINLTSELPHIIQGNLTIDASGAGVILNGNHTPADTVGLFVDSENNTIKGLQILHFSDCGIKLTANARACSISGNNITNNDYGIWLSQSSNISISHNDIANNTYGIWFDYSSNNTISGNNITNNGYGIWLLESTNNFLSDNNIANNQFSFTVDGKSLSDYVNNVDSSNTVDGKPLYYFVNKRNMTVPIDGGYLALINCTQMTIKNQTIGPFLAYTTNSTITENNINGIGIYWCSNNRIYRNKITNNSFAGITFNNSTSNSIYRNNITDNLYGIFLWFSSNNSIFENNIVGNDCAIALASFNNTLFHNNFINNTKIAIGSGKNTWDDGYPSGGNYWSNYTDVDLLGGPYQNETGSDGIGDTPYIINENNQDKYPLIHPYGSIRNLDTNLTYLTIQSAIDAPETQDGHTILVEAGSYYEHLVIVKSISLVGKDKHNTIIDGNGTGTVVDIIADNVYINGFTIQKSGGDILNPKFGIYMTSSGNNISFNRVMNNLYGVCLDYSSFNTVSGNNLTNNEWYGVFLYQSSNNTVSQNDMTNNDHGTELYNSSNNTISGNRIANNVCNGINLWNSSSNTILENDITNNVCGITLHDSSGNNVYRNNITSNKAYGINLGELSSNNLFYNNDFVNNTKQVSKGLGSTNHWDNGYLCGGNYWSDFTDVDQYSGPYQNETGSDGIWDTPYVIDENNQDNYPIVPEFPSLLILPLFIIATLLVVIAYRTSRTQKKRDVRRFSDSVLAFR